MFILESTLQPRDKLTEGIIAYSLGLLGIVIFAVLVRDLRKIAASILVLLLIVFGLSILLHVVSAPIYNPLAPFAEKSRFVVESIRNSTNLFDAEDISFGNIDIETLERWSFYLFAIDYFIVLVISMIGTLSLVWIMDLASSKKQVSTGFLMSLALVLFTIGLIITPIIHLSLTSLGDFGGNTLVGSNYIAGNVEILGNFADATQEDINLALKNFLLAAENIRNARNSIQMFYFIYGFFQVTSVLLHFMDASLILLSGIEHLINGSYQIFQGFNDVSEALNQSETSESIRYSRI
jgi:hypothetical protein